MFDPANVGAKEEKRRACKKVEGWVLSRLPPELRGLPTATLRVSVREQACNDPNCAPIDTIVEFLFRSELRGMVGLPCEVGEVREATIDEEMPPAAVLRDWHAGKPTPWPPEPEPPSGVTLRFARGGRVQCYIGGAAGWVGGSVAALWCAFARARRPSPPRSLGDKAERARPLFFRSRSLSRARYREPGFPPNFFAPYQIQLDDGRFIFAPEDSDRCIRAEHAPAAAALEVSRAAGNVA